MSHSNNCSNGFHCSCCNPLWKSFLPENFNLKDLITEIPIPSKTTEPYMFTVKTDPPSENPGEIITMENGEIIMVEAMGIHNHKIIATGTYDEVKSQMPDHTTERTLINGQTLLPGLIEPHLHILPTAMFNLGIDLSPFEGQDLRDNVPGNKHPYSQTWVIDTMKEKAINAPDNQWLFGRNVDPSLFSADSPKNFNAKILDQISDSVPILIMNASMHLGYVNSYAITYLKDKHNVKVGKDGILHEMPEIVPVIKVVAMSYGTSLLPKLNDEVTKIFDEATKRGVTYMLDAGVDPDFGMVDYLKSRASLNCRVRIAGALVTESQEDFEKRIVGRFEIGKGNELFNLPYIKIVSDGSNQGLTGYQSLPYSCNKDYEKEITLNEGIFNFDHTSDFDELLQTIVAKNYPLMIHANGDKAIKRTIEGLSKTGLTNATIETRRDRMEHASLLSDEDIKKMTELGVSPSFLIGHVGYWGWVFQNTIFSHEKSEKLDRCNSALEHQMRITLHSDNSVTPIGPLRMMEQAITRVMEAAPQELPIQIHNEHERITREAALRAITYDAAWQCHADEWVGSLEPGKYADFVILEQSPLTYNNTKGRYPEEGMRDIKVLETWKGGVLRPFTLAKEYA